MLVQPGSVRDRLARVLGRARQLERLGPVEGGRRADLALLVRVDLDEGAPSRISCRPRRYALAETRKRVLTPFSAAFAAALALLWPLALGVFDAPPLEAAPTC